MGVVFPVTCDLLPVAYLALLALMAISSPDSCLLTTNCLPDGCCFSCDLACDLSCWLHGFRRQQVLLDNRVLWPWPSDFGYVPHGSGFHMLLRRHLHRAVPTSVADKSG